MANYYRGLRDLIPHNKLISVPQFIGQRYMPERTAARSRKRSTAQISWPILPAAGIGSM
jgi:hypothetical protein